MIGGISPRGYTIVEVLIFMAVSGLMFVMAIYFVGGKQSSVEFRQGLYDVNAEIRSAVNDVADGRFDALAFGSSTRCQAPAAGGPPVINNSGSVEQGANGGAQGCIFLGKVMQFNVSDYGGDSRNYFSTFTVAGRQVEASGLPVTSFSAASPTAIFPIAGRSTKDLTNSQQLQSGLESAGMFYCSGALCATRQSIGAVGFFGSFNPALGTASSSAQSGGQSVTTAYVPGSVWGDSRNGTANKINSNAQLINNSNIVRGGKYILLCFRNGTKEGAVMVGGVNGQQFTTNVKIGPPSVTGC